ncbi:MAG: hypothetical protein QW057_06705 [Candidatus Bathyarchaeia archaeon]
MRIAFIGCAVYNGGGVSRAFFMVPGTGRTQPGDWAFTPNSSPFPSGTIATIQMQV